VPEPPLHQPAHRADSFHRRPQARLEPLSSQARPTAVPNTGCCSLVKEMRSVRQFAVVVLLLVSYLTPAMACMISDVQMTREERACCRTMKNQCGQMEMPASHGCCQKTPQSAHDSALDTKSVAYHPVAVAMVWLTVAEQFHPTPITAGWVEHSDDSPPQPPPNSISVLRI